MILHDGKEYYPLDFETMIKNGKVYYDRFSRNKSYFYLDLRTLNSGQETVNENTGA